MTTEQIAEKFGVALPETSVKLDWKHSTLFFWNEKKRLVILLGGFIKHEIDVLDGQKTPAKGVYIPAPQMNEIAPFLPVQYSITKGTTTIGIDLLYYPNGTKIILECNNIAEAFAEFYLQLKEKGLLCKD
jgi:hypothetical protein